MADICRRAEELGLDCLAVHCSDTLRTTTPYHRLAVLPVEIATTFAFKTWALQLAANKLLGRIVIDEAHVVLTDASYRSTVSQVSQLFQHNTLLFVLTATLPISLEDLFRKALGALHLKFDRKPSSKPTPRYIVDPYTSERIVTRIQRAI